RDAIQHFPRGFIRERKEQNILRIDPVFEEVSYTVSKGARLTRTGPGDYKDRTGGRGHCCELLFVELSRVINMDRRRSWRALQRVLTGHVLITDFRITKRELHRTAEITYKQITLPMIVKAEGVALGKSI